MGDAHSIPGRVSDPSPSGRRVEAPSPRPGRQLVHAAVVADARSRHAPGAVLLESGRVLASGSPESIGALELDHPVLHRPEALVCPPLVNAHVHLDLSDLPAPETELPFEAWLARVRAHRSGQAAEGAVEAAVAQGVEDSRRGGCPWVGDICGSLRALEALLASTLRGVGYLEILGHDARSESGLELVGRLDELDPGGRALVAGISPHAPYSTGPVLYEAAARSGRPVSTHLAESLEEVEWCRFGTGPFAELLERVGYGAGEVPHPGLAPVEAVLPRLPGDRASVVHLNYLEGDSDLERLAAHGAAVVYCPRASRYLGHPRSGEAPHRWRTMLEHGIPVALGTDGRPCLPGPGLRGRRLSVLDDARLLIRDGATFEEWFSMATEHGAAALGLSPELVRLDPGRKLGLLSIPLEDPRRVVPEAEGEVEWLFLDDELPAGNGR